MWLTSLSKMKNDLSFKFRTMSRVLSRGSPAERVFVTKERSVLKITLLREKNDSSQSKIGRFTWKWPCLATLWHLEA